MCNKKSLIQNYYAIKFKRCTFMKNKHNYYIFISIIMKWVPNITGRVREVTESPSSRYFKPGLFKVSVKVIKGLFLKRKPAAYSLLFVEFHESALNSGKKQK